MSKFKKSQYLSFYNSGFTLVELIVVVGIMVILTSVFVLNWAAQRASRDIKIAQNKLVSDIRKVQSYTLSAKTLPSGKYAQYYLLKFNLNEPSKYVIQAISDANSSPQIENVETIDLPANIRLAETNPISISRSLNPTTQTVFSLPPCALMAFAAPFGKVILNDGCSPANLSSSPQGLNLTDDYYAKIINFQSNIACDGNNGNPPNPTVCTASTDSIMTISLTNKDKTVSKTVTVNGITGSVTFN